MRSFDPSADRRAWLWARHGRPETVSAAEALNALGMRDQVHPRDVFACLYRDQEAAEAYAAANLENHGHPTLGTYNPSGKGVVGVIDLRPAMKAMGRTVTDPSEADDA